MSRIQALLIGAAVLVMAGCRPSTKTVPDYLHDIDSANAQVEKYHRDPAKYGADPDVMNAGSAVSTVMTSAKLRSCWPTKGPVATVTTDHACVDRQGYTR